MNPVLLSSKSNEHYTPDCLLEPVYKLLGCPVGLDPCSNSTDPIEANVKAKKYFTEREDGLSQSWGNVDTAFLNPPFGKGLSKWVAKLTNEYKEGSCKEALLLIPSRTDTSYWALLKEYSVCFVKGRVVYKGNTGSAPFPTSLIFLPNKQHKIQRESDFYNVFSPLGIVYKPVQF